MLLHFSSKFLLVWVLCETARKRSLPCGLHPATALAEPLPELGRVP